MPFSSPSFFAAQILRLSEQMHPAPTLQVGKRGSEKVAQGGKYAAGIRCPNPPKASPLRLAQLARPFLRQGTCLESTCPEGNFALSRDSGPGGREWVLARAQAPPCMAGLSSPQSFYDLASNRLESINPSTLSPCWQKPRPFIIHTKKVLGEAGHSLTGKYNYYFIKD